MIISLNFVTFKTGVNTTLNMSMIMKIVFSFGRVNPPTSGHRKLVEKLCLEAEKDNGVARLYLSMSQDAVRNPLSAEKKLSFARELFPEIEVRSSRTLFNAIDEMVAEGFDEAVFCCGEDRYEDFSKTFNQYLGPDIFKMKSVEVRKIDRTDEDVSASKAREAVLNNDWKSFCELSASTDEQFNNNIFVELRNMMGA